MSKKKIGNCNICLKKTKLTWEHVPPKSCGNFEKVFIQDELSLSNLKVTGSQNGVKYRTICQKCNNEMGSGPDKELKKFYDSVKDFFEKDKKLNSFRIININLQLLTKAVFGKLLAIDEEPAMDLVSKGMRDFILNDVKPEELALYFRLYPYNFSVQARTFVCGSYLPIFTTNNYNNPYLISGLVSILNFFPIAFTVSSIENKENNAFVNLLDYINFSNPNINLRYSYLSAINPYTKLPLPYDWLIGVGDDKHPMVLTSGNSPAKVSWKSGKKD